MNTLYIRDTYQRNKKTSDQNKMKSIFQYCTCTMHIRLTDRQDEQYTYIFNCFPCVHLSHTQPLLHILKQKNRFFIYFLHFQQLQVTPKSLLDGFYLLALDHVKMYKFTHSTRCFPCSYAYVIQGNNWQYILQKALHKCSPQALPILATRQIQGVH